MRTQRHWLRSWLGVTARPWDAAINKHHARLTSLETRMADLERALEEEGAAQSLENWKTPDMDAHLGAN